MRDLASENTALREENEILRERLRQIAASLGADDHFPASWGLTGAETKILAVLSRRATASPEAIRAAYGGDDPLREDIPRNTIATLISNLRRKLGPLGVRIANVPGEGYRLDPIGRDFVVRHRTGGLDG